MTVVYWWGVINPHGQLSVVHSMRGIAEADMMGRQDGEDCWVAPVKVEYDPVRPKLVEPIKKGKRK